MKISSTILFCILGISCGVPQPRQVGSEGTAVVQGASTPQPPSSVAPVAVQEAPVPVVEEPSQEPNVVVPEVVAFVDYSKPFTVLGIAKPALDGCGLGRIQPFPTIQQAGDKIVAGELTRHVELAGGQTAFLAPWEPLVSLDTYTDNADLFIDATGFGTYTYNRAWRAGVSCTSKFYVRASNQ